MNVKQLLEAIEETLLQEPLTMAEAVARFENTSSFSRYEVVAAIRGMKMAGRLIDIKGKLYLHRFSANGDQ